MIAVAVGEDDPADVAELASHRAELTQQVVPVPGQSGVDQGDALGGVDEVGRDDVIAEAVELGGDSHCRLLSAWITMATVHSLHG